MSADRPENKMGTHKPTKARKLARAALRRWSQRRRKHSNDQPPRELRRSW